MLDLLRKHASSWLIKTILVLVILTFILFFGYSSFYRQYLSSQQRIAVVEGKPVPRQKFDLIYQQSLQQFQKQLGEGNQEIPDALRTLLKKNILSQLISQQVMSLFGERLGIEISDETLAKAITSDPQLAPQGSFDANAYQEFYLPSYERRYGENYEVALKRELTADRLSLVAPLLFSPWQKVLSSAAPPSAPKKKEETPFESISPTTLLTGWVEEFQKKVKIDVNPTLTNF